MKQYLENHLFRYLLYCLAVLPLFIFRDFTLDNELRYLSIADEALRKGSLFTFTNHGIIYADKPPLYLWIVMLGKLLLGYHSMVFLAIFSFLPALAILFVMDRWTKDLLSPRERLTAELLLLTSAFYIGTAIVLRMDMLMCLFIVLALYIFFRMYSGNAHRWDSWLFPLCVFMALFTKGPLGLIVPLLTTSVFLFIKKELKAMGQYWGRRTWVLLVALCGIWFTGVYLEGGSKYFNDLLFNQTVNRAVNSFHHSEPFFYYLLAIWYSLAPWSLLLMTVLVMGIRKRLYSGNLELLFLVAILSTLSILSLFSSKLQVYMLPSFPFIIYLSLLWLKRLSWPRWIYLLVVFPAVLLCLSLPAAIAWRWYTPDLPLIVLLTALILSLTGMLTLIHLRKNLLYKGIIHMSTGILLSVFILSFAIPRYNGLIGLGELSQKAKDIALEKGAENYYYCRISRADNLDVYLGREPEKLTIKDLYKSQDKIRKPAILFVSHRIYTRSDSVKHYLQGRKMHRSGKYYFVEIDH